MVSKGPHVLLDAYRLLEPGSAELHLYGAQAAYHGDDSYRERLTPLLASPGVHVHGPRPHDRIPAALRQLDVLVVPSVWPENSPLVIHEALLSRVAVVAARTGGITELITDGQNGYLFEPGDVEGLARLLDRLARHPEALAIVGTGAPGIRTIHADVQATVALYERLASATARARPVTRVAAVVVHHRTTEDTGIALRALRASARPFDDVVVVNNDGEPAAEGLPALATTWIDAGANLGFSGGVNLGVRAALDRGATHVLLVNSDVVVPPDTAERLMAALDQVPGAGIAGPVVASRTRPDTIASAGIRYSRPTGRMRHRRFGEPVDRLPPSGPELVDAVSGCVMLVRREVFDRAGVFDDDYFYGFEDIDFCLTAQARGYRTVLAADAVVYHHGGQSIGPESPRRLYFGVRNHLLLASRLSDGDMRFTRLVRGVNIVMLNVAHAMARPGGARLNGLRAVARGIADYASGTFGAGR
jgi:GT2 family glycosyltransferase